MIILLGKTASGKDTICNYLVQKHHYKRIVTYTSRPMRPNEKDNVHYHFITKEDFIEKINNKFFAEWKAYETEFGIWYYGTALEDLENIYSESIIILTPAGYKDIIKKMPKRPISILIDADDNTIKKRLIKRGDDPKEAERRLLHDNDDFIGIENEVDYIIHNNDGTNINDIVNEILTKGSDSNSR